MGDDSARTHHRQGGHERGQVRVQPKAPEELTRGRPRRLGEGIGEAVYASPQWVVKRERQPSEIMALIRM